MPLMKRDSVVLVAALSMIIPSALFILPSVASATPGLSTANFAVIQELAKPAYAGRQAGTSGYAQGVDYLQSKMVSSGMQPIFGDKQYKVPFKTGVVDFTKSDLNINGKSYVLAKDYQPYSRITSGSYSFKNAYFVGGGVSSDYTANTPGLVIFGWYDGSGKFPSGILDRINIAIAHGATGVLIIANGELKIGNFEHVLNSNTLSTPVAYITPEIANTMGIPKSFLPAALSPLSVSMDFSVTRTANQSADNLVGIIPGKQEAHSILWVTNIDGFGTLPTGVNFQSAISGSVSAAMMLDLASYYSQNQPEYTMIFAFIGDKWKDGLGIQALTKRLNFNHIDTILDLYAMGGDTDPTRINVSYTDTSFSSMAKSLSSNAYENSDLGNALSSGLTKYSKKVLLIRDNNTWIDNSLGDTAASVNLAAYSSGLDSLLNYGNKISAVLTLGEDEPLLPATPIFKKITLQTPAVTLNQTESNHFIIYTDDKNQTGITSRVLKEMDTIYERVNFYNYEVIPKSKVIAMYLENGNDAAVISGRADLANSSDQAGGGFANFTHDTLYVYIEQIPSYETVSHELNHALASANTYFALNSALQEWQGQSNIVRYSDPTSSGTFITDRARLINTSFLSYHEVPNLRTHVTNYATSINWNWFTKNANNPDGWLTTYYIAGSMYSFLDDQFGAQASRRAMYRNYDDVTKFKANMVADTGLSFEEFLQSWSYWMLHSGLPLDSSAANKKLNTAKNDWFDWMMLYTLPIASPAPSSGTTPTASRDTKLISANVDGFLVMDYSSTPASDVVINSLSVTQNSTQYIFSFDLTSLKSRTLYFFKTGPSGSAFASHPVNTGKSSFIVAVDKSTMPTDGILGLSFTEGPDVTTGFGLISVESLQSVPKANALPSSTPTPVVTSTPEVDPSAPLTPQVTKKPVASASPKAKTATILCIKGKLIKKLTAIEPKCPKGYKKK